MEGTALLERVLEPQNRRRALQQVRRHQGAPGIDGMIVDDLEAPLQTQGPTIRAALLEGSDAPQPVRRAAIPKPGGEPATWGCRSASTGSSSKPCCRCGRRKGTPHSLRGATAFARSATLHQAVGQAQGYIRAGYTWVVDSDREQCFDQVNHAVWLSRVRRRGHDRRVVTLIQRFLKAGVLTLAGRVAPTAEGPPHGGPRSPLLANRLLDELDEELEKRGPRFARYADEANRSVRSRQAGEGVMARVTRFLKRKLWRKVRGQERSRPTVEPEVPRLHVHEAPA